MSRRRFALLLASSVPGLLGTTPEPLVDLPFHESTPPHRIVVDIAPEANARRMPLTLDTGAVTTVMTPRFARSLGVRVSATRPDPYRRATRLGRDLLFHVLTRRSDTGATGGGFEFGLLGGNFLSDYVVELDFRARRVRFYDPDRFEVPESTSAQNEAVLPLTIVSNRPAVRARVNGTELDLLLDTGMPLGLLLSGEHAVPAGVESDPVPGFAMKGVLGPVETELGEVERLEIGPFGFDRVAVAVAPHGWYNAGFPGDSMLGIDLLSQFLVRIDYPRKRLWLRRDPEAVLAFDAGTPHAIAQLSSALPPEPPNALEAFAPRGEPDPQQVWLEWGSPSPAEHIEGPVGWVEVSGWAGVGNPVQHDVVIALDVSGSTAVASGVDVDGDGTLGKKRRRIEDWRSFNPRHLSSDPGDTLLAAELVATRRLVELLDPDRTRIGLVVFSSGARIVARLGSDRARMQEVLDELEESFGSGATHLAAAIERGSEVLEAAEGRGTERRKTLLVISDGWPTAPGSEQAAAEAASDAAAASAAIGHRIDTFGLGLADVGPDHVYARIAAHSGGQYIRLSEPGAILHELPKIDLAEVASIEIENATTGSEGRAVRVRPDGSFDGFLLLEPGENRVRVSARGDEGGDATTERTVHFDARAPRDAAEAEAFERRLAALRTTLETRRIETELVQEIEAARLQKRELVVEGEAAVSPTGRAP